MIIVDDLCDEPMTPEQRAVLEAWFTEQRAVLEAWFTEHQSAFQRAFEDMVRTGEGRYTLHTYGNPKVLDVQN